MVSLDFDLSFSVICLGRWLEQSLVRGPHPVHNHGDHRGEESRAGDDHGELPPGHSTTRDERVGQGVGGIFTSRKRGRRSARVLDPHRKRRRRGNSKPQQRRGEDDEDAHNVTVTVDVVHYDLL